MVIYTKLKSITRSRLTVLLCTTVLSIYLGIVLPLHHHDDGDTHDECQLCAVQQQPTVAVAVVALPPLVYSHIETIAYCFHTHYSPACLPSYQTRAPPAFVSASWIYCLRFKKWLSNWHCRRCALCTSVRKFLSSKNEDSNENIFNNLVVFTRDRCNTPAVCSAKRVINRHS